MSETEERLHKVANTKAKLRIDFHKRLEPVVLDFFSNSGFHRASLKELSRKTGISTRTIYKHYGSKEELLFAFVDDWLKTLTGRMIDHLKGMESTKEKLRKVFWIQLDFYEHNPEVGRILFLTVPWQEWMSDKTFQQKRMYSLFLDTIRQGQNNNVLNPELRAGTIIDLMQGFVIRLFTMWIYREKRESLTHNFDTLFKMLWRAISVE